MTPAADPSPHPLSPRDPLPSSWSCQMKPLRPAACRFWLLGGFTTSCAVGAASSARVFLFFCVRVHVLCRLISALACHGLLGPPVTELKRITDDRSVPFGVNGTRSLHSRSDAACSPEVISSLPSLGCGTPLCGARDLAKRLARVWREVSAINRGCLVYSSAIYRAVHHSEQRPHCVQLRCGRCLSLVSSSTLFSFGC